MFGVSRAVGYRNVCVCVCVCVFVCEYVCMYVYMGQAFMFSVSRAAGYRIVYKCTGRGGGKEEEEGVLTSNE